MSVLDIPYRVKRFLDDYIACMQTKYERLQTCAIWRENKDYKKMFILSKIKVL